MSYAIQTAELTDSRREKQIETSQYMSGLVCKGATI